MATTPPCADALVEAGVARVVAGQTDPNPGARRRARASRARPESRSSSPTASSRFRCRQQIEEWRTWVTEKSPFVTYKVAVSRSTGGSPCPTRAGSAARTRGGWCTCCALRRTPSQWGWEPCAGRTHGSTRAASPSSASRAGSHSGEARCRRARSSSCAPGPPRGAGAPRRGWRSVVPARRRPDARGRVPRAGSRRQDARLRGAEAGR